MGEDAMRDIEEALKRAQSPQQVRPQVEPIEGVPHYSAQAAATSDHGLANVTVPTYGKSRDYPVLKADYDAFQRSMGGSTKDGRNVNGAFRVLRTQVLSAMKERGARILGVTSPSPEAGKTVTAINLALACSRREEQSVVLADFDYRRPSVAQYLHATDFPSSINYFQGDGELDDYFQRSEQGNLRYLLTDTPTEMSAEYLASSKMDEALSQITRSSNTIVIADLPPMIGCDDTFAMMPKLDGIILVVASGTNGYDTIERVVSQIPESKLVATVLNKISSVDGTYSYDY